MKRLGDYIEITNGYAFKSSNYSEKGGRIIRITNVQKNLIKDNDPKFYPFDLLKKIENYKIYENDILMSLTGNVGRVAKFPKELLPAYINQRVCRVKSKNDILYDGYLFHILNSNDFEQRAIANSSGAAQLNLSTEWLKDLIIPLPPIETQKRIAEILDNAAALRDKTAQLLAEYDALAQSLFLEMFGDPITNPKGWEVKKLIDLTTKIGSGATPRGGKNAYKEEGISLIRSLNIYDNEFKYKDLAFIDEKQAKRLDNVIVEKNDVLINITGASVARCTIVPEEVLPARVNQHVSILRPKNEIIDSTFLLHLIISPSSKIKFIGVGSSGGATREAITKSQLEEFEIPVPPIELQNEFAEKIASIEKQKELAKKNCKKVRICLMPYCKRLLKGS